jgi:hypothetical protein
MRRYCEHHDCWQEWKRKIKDSRRRTAWRILQSPWRRYLHKNCGGRPGRCVVRI